MQSPCFWSVGSSVCGEVCTWKNLHVLLESKDNWSSIHLAVSLAHQNQPLPFHFPMESPLSYPCSISVHFPSHSLFVSLILSCNWSPIRIQFNTSTSGLIPNQTQTYYQKNKKSNFVTEISIKKMDLLIVIKFKQIRTFAEKGMVVVVVFFLFLLMEKERRRC